MSRVLYFMQVPWDWVKQRPHFLAEGLAESQDITVIHNKPYTRFKLARNSRPNSLRIKELYVLPFGYLSKINSVLVTAQARTLLADTDIVWLTHPFQYAQLKDAITEKHTLIYDCMDNMLEFAFVKNDVSLYSRLFDIEKQLLNRCDFALASAEHLKQVLLQRYALQREICVVNNGITLYPSDNYSEGPNLRSEVKVISYIGTIAEWLDFDLILESLDRYESIAYHLYGPCEISIPQHERLKYFGRVEHKLVYPIMERSNALIMPFKLNDLVLSIDPVKLYEYAYSHRPAIAVKYEESSKFAEFVHLYNSPAEYFALIEQLSNDQLEPMKSASECTKFAEGNTWGKRVDQVRALIDAKKQ